jgi:hypothetical protein
MWELEFFLGVSLTYASLSTTDYQQPIDWSSHEVFLLGKLCKILTPPKRLS